MLIVFEGIDGSGKSGQIRRLEEYFRQEGQGYALFKYPTSKAADALSHLRGEKEVSADRLAEIFAQDIAFGQDSMRREMANGKVAICDRYLHSTLAYQAVDVGYERLKRRLLQYRLIEPDLVLLFDIDARVAAGRKGRQKEPDRFEKDSAFLQKVRENYLREKEECFLSHKYFVADASMPKDEVFSEVITQVEPLLTGRGRKQ